METQAWHRKFCVIAALTALLVMGAQSAAAQPSAPAPVSPAAGAILTTPAFSWQAAGGAAKYEVEVGPQSDPNAVYWSAQTVNRTLTPTDAAKFANGTLYWRVRAKDNSNVPGPWSEKVNFTLSIPAPSPVVASAWAGSDEQTGLAPTLEWRPTEGGATSYKVEVSASPTFLPVEAIYGTYNERVTPVSTLAHGAHYWRVSGLDADGHAGAPSAGRKFTKGSAAPVLVKPDVDAVIATPELEWAAVVGAAYYKVELSSSATFVPVAATFTTYNLGITPVRTLAPGATYWRVSGVDADGHVGSSNERHFTLSALPAATDPTPQLLAPADAATITAGPTFRWSRAAGANRYRLVVSKYADFHATYDSADTDYASYTPYTAGSWDAYADGVHYWRVEARGAGNAVIATSAARSFRKKQPLPLSAPAAGAALTADPSFQWSPVVGADRYRLIVSKYADFRAPYDSVYTEYGAYTPYTPGSRNAYANGAYYWKVEAWSAGNAVIAASEVRGFRKAQPLLLGAPADGAKGASDPTFQWGQVVGAKRYRLIVSKYADFHAVFDSVYTDYNRYTPYTAGSVDTYPKGAYYWKVEAWDSGNTVITTSNVRSFTIG
jgi:hypothetical protein